MGTETCRGNSLGNLWMKCLVAFVSIVCPLSIGLASASAAADYALTVTSDKTVDEAFDLVKSFVGEEGLTIAGIHPLPANPPYLLVEVCEARQARAMIAAEPELGLLLPCGKIAVYREPGEKGRTRISMLLPSALTRLSSHQALQEMVRELEPRLKRIVHRAQ